MNSKLKNLKSGFNRPLNYELTRRKFKIQTHVFTRLAPRLYLSFMQDSKRTCDSKIIMLGKNLFPV